MGLNRNGKRISVLLAGLLTAVLLTVYFFYFAPIRKINALYHNTYDTTVSVSLRKFPFPYRAALAISNDADNTETLDEFIQIHKFLNSSEMTSVGRGVNLEIGDSFLPFEPASGAISYFGGDGKIVRVIDEFIREGTIDIIHSYGKKPGLSRMDAFRMISELRRKGLKLEVWVDHDRSPSNMGDDVTFGTGDHPGSSTYHADMTIKYGIRFAWLGRVTMVIGQATPIGFETFASIYDPVHPFYSLLNIAKEVAKNVLGILGSRKYALHGTNDLVQVRELDDGQKIFEFMRFDNYWRGVGTGATNRRLAYVLSERTLERLKKVGGFSIVYTHLGKNDDCEGYMCPETIKALRRLAREYRRGDIYVAKTSSLLNYYVARRYLKWDFQLADEEVTIHIRGIEDPVSGFRPPRVGVLAGMTFYVPEGKRVRIFVGEEELKTFVENPPDYTGRRSVMIPLDVK